MAIQVGWDDETNAILCLAFERHWTWDDLTRAITEADGYIVGRAPDPVDIILDMSHSRSIPLDFWSMARQLAGHADEARENEGNRVLAGASLPLRLAYQSIAATYGAQLRQRDVLFAANRDEARKILLKKRPRS